jgi:TonB-linked SusC/RagA family outer membrane protein
MKLSFLLFALVFFNVHGNSYSQNKKLSLEIANGSVKSILERIEAESKFNFFYKSGELDLQRTVSISVTDRSIQDILDIIFNEGDIVYKIMKRQIVLKRKISLKGTITMDKEIFLNNPPLQYSVSGKVTDTQGIPLPGTSIVEKGTTNGTQTDFDGSFEFNVTDNSSVLIVSYIGYLTQEVEANKSPFNIIMTEDDSKLDEVVVIGYGTTLKKDLVSSVSQVKSEDIENQPVARLDQALQGAAAGVEVTSNNGAPGAGSTIRIRGNSSLSGNNNPLYVLDGFIIGNDFDLNTININDIKSIEILKDATALSIYGTQGAAGVILITTKDGSGIAPGKPQISLNHYSSIQETANEVEILGGVDYVNYINEASQFVPGNSGFGESDSSLPLAYGEPGTVPTTDWIDLISQTGTINNTDFSITGNSEKTNYFLSLNLFNQKGIVRASGLERVTLRANQDIKVSDRLTVGYRINASHYKREVNKVDYNGIVTSVLPVRTVFDDNGDFTGVNPISGTPQRNPEADIQLRTDHDLVTKLITSAYLQIELVEGLKFKTSAGSDITHLKENNYLPGILPDRITGGFGRVNTNFQKNILNDNILTYKNLFGKHSLEVLGGFSWQKSVNESTRTQADGLPNDATSFNNLQSGNPLLYFVDSGYGQRTLTSFLGRASYGFNSKYLITLVGRYDGSSVFQTGNKYSFFPSVGAAWNVDQENFLRNSDIIDRLKLRGSYGIVGEQGVAPYNSASIYNNVLVTGNETTLNGIQIGRLPSSGLEWETTRQLDLGLELGFFQNRISFEFDYYKKTTTDLLLARELSAQVGGGTQLQNVGSVENKGFEFSLNTFNIQNEDFSWETALTISSNRSKILELDGQDFINLQSTGNQGGNSARLVVGEAFPAFVGANYLGTYKTQEEIIADGREGASFIGGPRFEDLDGNGIWDEQDQVVLGSPQPDFFGGLRNSFKFKGLSLDVFFQGSYGAEIFNTISQSSFYGRSDQNLDPRVLNRWISGVNETSNVPRAGTSPSIFNPNSSVNVEDASFLRLRTLTLGYNFPLDAMDLDSKISGLNVYITGTNLLLFSDFKLGDPEVNNFTSANTNNDFGGVSQGFAAGQYPYPRTITVGVNLKF